jgi:hypothetical protein
MLTSKRGASNTDFRETKPPAPLHFTGLNNAGSLLYVPRTHSHFRRLGDLIDDQDNIPAGTTSPLIMTTIDLFEAAIPQTNGLLLPTKFGTK